MPSKCICRFINSTEWDEVKLPDKTQKVIGMLLKKPDHKTTKITLRNIQLFKVLLQAWEIHLFVAEDILKVEFQAREFTQFLQKFHGSNVLIHAYDESSISIYDKLQIMKNVDVNNIKYETLVMWPSQMLITESIAFDLNGL